MEHLTKGSLEFIVLERIDPPTSIADSDIPAEIQQLLDLARLRIQTFQDRWDQPQMEQFVAADYVHVYQTLRWLKENVLTIGGRFLEWGCGFAVVCAIADSFGWDAIGIEAESVLLAEGRQTIIQWNSAAELVHGNFLPPGAEKLADQEILPSLGHPISCGYRQLGLDLDDFAIVYAYPWPGEDKFHESVFDRYAARGALLVLFCGPNDICLWRKAN